MFSGDSYIIETHKGLWTMELKPVHSEADYEAALKEIDKLMDAQPGTLEGDR
jgi:hypothetical protein